MVGISAESIQFKVWLWEPEFLLPQAAKAAAEAKTVAPAANIFINFIL